MAQVVYGTPKLTIREQTEHLCFHGCQPTSVDPSTGHMLGYWCKKLTIESGLRLCDICDRQYINPNKYENPKYETNCPECVKRYGLEDV